MKAVSTISALFLAAASTVVAQSTVNCVYASWANNGDGKTPCELWAALGSKCGTFTVEPLGAIANGTSPGYPALTSSTANDCQCNHVAYSLMAACAWCQADVYADSWVSESDWSQACGSKYQTSGVASSVNASDLNIPPYATQPIPGPVWDPTDAQAAFGRLGSSGTVNGTSSTGSATMGRTVGIAASSLLALGSLTLLL